MSDAAFPRLMFDDAEETFRALAVSLVLSLSYEAAKLVMTVMVIRG